MSAGAEGRVVGTAWQCCVVGGSSLLEGRAAPTTCAVRGGEGGMLRENPSLTPTLNVCPGPQGVLLWGSPSQLALRQGCVQRLSSRAGADSQHSGHSQVRSAWPGGRETVSGDGNAVKSSSFSGKQTCPLPAGVISSARHAFLLPVPSHHCFLQLHIWRLPARYEADGGASQEMGSWKEPRAG